MAALSTDWSMVDSSFTVTNAAGAVLDLTGIVQLQATNALAYDTDGNVIIRVGLSTAKFVVTPPQGAALTFDKRMGAALKRLGLTVPTF
jgi:hypothetical protein